MTRSVNSFSAVALRCSRRMVAGKRLSLRKIAQELAAAGLLNERGSEYNPNAIKRMTAPRETT